MARPRKLTENQQWVVEKLKERKCGYYAAFCRQCWRTGLVAPLIQSARKAFWIADLVPAWDEANRDVWNYRRQRRQQ